MGTQWKAATSTAAWEVSVGVMRAHACSFMPKPSAIGKAATSAAAWEVSVGVMRAPR